MNLGKAQHSDIEEPSFLLALHSSSETLGVATLDCRKPESSRRSSTFPVGRALSKNLFSYIEELLPSKSWPQLARIAVATGPGGFTGTRITVVMARTLAQQIGCCLDGISSFKLMAPRLIYDLKPNEIEQPFWIVQHLKRRGTVGGCYLAQKQSRSITYKEVLELQQPHLLSPEFDPIPAIDAYEDVESDVLTLLNNCETAHKTGKSNHWSDVLPIYPTSPVGNL